MTALPKSQLLERAFHEAVDRLDSHTRLASFAGGGHLRIEGPPALTEAWIRRRLGSSGLRWGLLDLEGWEPIDENLAPFFAYQAAARGIEPDRETVVPPGRESQDAARLSLAFDFDGVPSGEAAQAEETLDQAVDRWAATGPLALITPAGDTLPEPVRGLLARRCLPASGLLWIDLRPAPLADGRNKDENENEADRGVLTPPELEDEPLENLAEELSRQLDEIAEGSALRAVLESWALLLGGASAGAPIDPVGEILGLDEEAREELVDRIDDELVEDGSLEILKDLQYLHPSFREAVYRPLHPAWIRVLTCKVEDRRAKAQELLAGFRRRLTPGRGAFTLLLRLAEQAEDAAAAARLRSRLRWWFEGETLETVLDPALEEGSVSADHLWHMATEGYWPPRHRLAFLDAARRANDDPARAGDAETLRAEILHRAGRLPEALDAVRRALEIQGLNHGPRSKPYLAALHLCSLLLIEAGETAVAGEQLELCRALADEVLEADDPKRITLLENQGRALAGAGNLREARRLFEQALQATEAARGPEHPATAGQRNNLAGLLLEIGELRPARRELERAAKDFERTRGPRSSEFYSTLRNLARVTDEMQDDAASFELWERLAPLEESILGGTHPNLLGTWSRLAELRRDRGDRDGARFLFERALALATELFYGDDHPSIPALESAIEDLDREDDGEADRDG